MEGSEGDGGRRRFRLALTGAVALGMVFAVLLALPSLSDAARATVGRTGIVLGGALLSIGGARAAWVCQGTRRRAWALLTAAASLGLAGNLWSALTDSDPNAPPGAAADLMLAVALAMSVVGLVGLAPFRQRGYELAILALDALVMGCAALVAVTVLVYVPLLQSVDGSNPGDLADLLTPLLDVALVTIALLLIIRSRAAPRFFTLVGTGFMLYVLSDLGFAGEAAQGGFHFGTALDLGWIWGNLLLAAATQHPDAVRSGAAPPPRHGAFDVRSTVTVFAVLLAAVVLQIVRPGDGTLTEPQLVLWALLVLAAGARQTFLTLDNAALRSGLERRVEDQTRDLRRMARETQILLDSVGEGIYGVDTDGRVTFVNPSAAELLGRSPAELRDRDAHQTFHVQVEGDAGGCSLTETIRHGVVRSGDDGQYRRGDGTVFPVESTSSPLVDGEQIRGAVVAFRDVTQRHEVDRMKGQLLSMVSHELRTPLTSIRGSLGLLHGGALVELPPRASRVVSIATQSVERLTRLINDILDVDRAQSDTLPMTLEARDAGALLQAAATEMEALAGAAGVRLRVVPTSVRVLADPDRVMQTLTNLVGNAVKFSPRGTEVCLEADAGPREVVFAVHDEGRGIPVDKLETVFEPFEQVDSSDSRQRGGTGLGLAISRAIVARHGGRIWAESGQGGGTTVRFTLPRVTSSGNLTVRAADAAPAQREATTGTETSGERS